MLFIHMNNTGPLLWTLFVPHFQAKIIPKTKNTVTICPCGREL